MPEAFRDLESFYESSLAQSVSSTGVTLIVNTAPTISSGFLVLEPNTANEEIVLMTARTGTSLTVVRGLATSGSSEAGSSGTQKAHGYGARVANADTHYYVKRLQVSNTFTYRGSFASVAAINAITTPSQGDVAIDSSTGFLYYFNGATWVVISGGSAPADASTTVKGITKVSVAPVSATDPIAVGDNDGRVPTQGENDALVGSSGTPSSTNKYITEDDVSALNVDGKIVRRDAYGLVAGVSKFGGTGVDGALSISSGTTVIDLAGAELVVKNYTDISITGTGALSFINPAAKGTIVILKAQGDVTITTSATRAIDMRLLGGAGGAGGASSGAGGGTGSDFDLIKDSSIHGGGGGSGGSPGTGGVVFSGGDYASTANAVNLMRHAYLVPGPGGGGGSAGTDGTDLGKAGGDGGRGGGALYIECNGAYSASGTFDAAGANGTAGTDNPAGGNQSGGGGGGGGGAGGMIVIVYNILTSDTGTYTVTAGSAGAGGDGDGATGGKGGGGAGMLTNAGSDGVTNSGDNGGAGGNSVVGLALRMLNTTIV